MRAAQALSEIAPRQQQPGKTWGGILIAPLTLPLTLPLSRRVNGTLIERKIGILIAQLAFH